MPRILCIGDCHFQRDNVEETSILYSKMNDYLSNNKFDFLVVMGDVLHNHAMVHTGSLNRAIDFLRMISSFSKTYVIVGNHDYINNTEFLSQNHWLNCLKSWKGLTVVDKPMMIEGFVFCPYVYDGRFIEALDKVEDWMSAHCIFSHVNIQGADMGNSIITENADVWEKDFPLLISGHIHKPQMLGENMYYTGSVLQVACNEDCDKSVMDVTIEGGKREIKRVSLELPCKKIINVKMSNIDEIKLPENTGNVTYILYIESSESFGDFVKTTIYKNLCKKLGKKNIKLKTIKKTMQKIHTGTFNDILKSKIKGDVGMEEFYKYLQE